jgi:predicted MFS family arabinose efflux permease
MSDEHNRRPPAGMRRSHYANGPFRSPENPRMIEEDGSGGMTRLLTLLFAVAGGVAVGNLYWVQPLLVEVAAAMHISAAAAGYLMTATQVGYAVGVLLLIPLGDTLDRKRLVPAVMGLSALALLWAAIAPTFGALLASLAAVGVTTVSGQILVPYAGDLARDEERGRVIGSIASGVLIGILLSRTISGFVAAAFGWRAIYFGAAAVTVILAGVLAVKLPTDRAKNRIGYAALLTSVAGAVRQHRAAKVTLLIGACAFSVFTMFWTAVTFLLSGAPFNYSVAQIGLVGLVGLAGALAARRAGRIHDRGLSVPASGAFLGLTLLSIGISVAGGHTILLLLSAVLLIDIAIQAVNVLNQTRLFSIDPASRSRLNTAFVFCNFVGGAVGSGLAGLLWQAGAWPLVMSGAAVITLIALTAWFFGRATLSAVIVGPSALEKPA